MKNSFFTSLSAQTHSELINLASAVADAVPIDVRTWEVDVKSLPPEKTGLKLIQDVSEWASNSKKCIYYFELCSPNIDLDKIKQAFAQSKEKNASERAYSRLNDGGKGFYVGSSQSIAKRLTEHLGYGASKTYALQLIHWARPLSLHLKFICAKYPETTSSNVIQGLEDTLWEIKKPIFGRQGRK